MSRRELVKKVRDAAGCVELTVQTKGTCSSGPVRLKLAALDVIGNATRIHPRTIAGDPCYDGLDSVTNHTFGAQTFKLCLRWEMI